MKGVSGQAEAVELDASKPASSEKQVLNPEVQGAEKFQFKLSRTRGRRRHCHHAWTVWKPGRRSHEQAAFPQRWGTDQRAETLGSNRTEELTQQMAVWILIIRIYA